MNWLRKKIIAWVLKDCEVGSWSGQVSFPVYEAPGVLQQPPCNWAYLVFQKQYSYGLKVREMA